MISVEAKVVSMSWFKKMDFNLQKIHLSKIYMIFLSLMTIIYVIHVT